MITAPDDWVLVVAVSQERPGGGGPLTFRDFVIDEHVHFHPLGSRAWPSDPPRYMAFRWQAAVQIVAPVMRVEEVPGLRVRWPDIPAHPDVDRPHAIYHMGDAIYLGRSIPSGSVFAPGHQRVRLHDLVEADSLADAMRRSASWDRRRRPARSEGRAREGSEPDG